MLSSVFGPRRREGGELGCELGLALVGRLGRRESVEWNCETGLALNFALVGNRFVGDWCGEAGPPGYDELDRRSLPKARSGRRHGRGARCGEETRKSHDGIGKSKACDGGPALHRLPQAPPAGAGGWKSVRRVCDGR